MPDLSADVVIGAIVGFAWFVLVNRAKGKPVLAGETKRFGRLIMHVGFILVAAVVAHYTAKNFAGGIAVGWAVTEGPQKTLFDQAKPGADKKDEKKAKQEQLDDLAPASSMGSKLRESAFMNLGRWYYDGR